MTVQDTPPPEPMDPMLIQITLWMQEAATAIVNLQAIAHCGPRENPQEIEMARVVLDRIRVMTEQPRRRRRRR